MPLSDVACKNAKPDTKEYKLSDGGGLNLHVMPSGSKLWRMKYRYMGKEKTLSIGPYPEIGLAQARKERDLARGMLANQQDPSVAKQEKKRLLAISASNTFEALARRWHEKNAPTWSPKHSATILHRLECDVFPEIGKMPISDIGTPRIAALIEAVEDRGAAEMARRCLQYCRAVFAYAKIHGLVQHNPADIKASDILSATGRRHHPAMEAKDLPVFLRKLYSNEARLYKPTQIAMEMMMYTFVRTGELIKARWEEFDFERKVWEIPASRMKMKRPHLVPLSNQVIVLLEDLKKFSGNRPYLFPGQRDPKGHMSNNALLVALKRMGYNGIHTGHGFRALALSTIMEELGYPYEIPDVQLAHAKKGDVEAAYNRAKFIKQRTQMMQDWADYIQNVRNGELVNAKSTKS